MEQRIIYTSYYAFAEKYKLQGAKLVSIAAKCPDWYHGREYKKLAPKYWFFKKYKENNDWAFYTEQFKKEVLDKLDSQQVYNELGNGAILLCWEGSGLHCHRHLIAQWLKEKLGITVIELTPDMVGTVKGGSK